MQGTIQYGKGRQQTLGIERYTVPAIEQWRGHL